ncbi:MAG: NAD-glutamate dehydrogenase [Sphingomonadales bacterium]|jgi:glutamate dehydrogenase|nr:NAD-glutamate dehydrogenase [Sphingomonadales bacterium]MBK9268034.1 NAD-glutamate dehydrogenase [Sphingomonadales bacterium]MBP6433314.1 NAD-glutamate dehydrogenase [Sphingorhabdus sp.]
MASADPKLAKPLLSAILARTLPGETDGFGKDAQAQAVDFMLATAARRKSGTPNIAVDTFSDEGGRLAMRVAIINDDMPFLVDSVAAALASANVVIERLIHPVVDAERDASGTLSSLSDKRGSTGKRESFIYVETSRIDAKERRALADSLAAVLEDVRCAVTDWRKMQGAMSDDSDSLPEGEGAALMRWFMDGAMTVLAHERIIGDGNRETRLGLARSSDVALLSVESIMRARSFFAEGGQAPLILKSSRVSTVHRAVQLDILVVPVRDGDKIKGLAVTGGLWTSNALATPPERIPLLRTQLSDLLTRYGFDPSGHAGKAMSHALTSLPHDLLVSFNRADLERVTLTAMSLTDRPRPKLLAVRSALGRHAFVFIWLPRDDISTGLRRAIEAMLTETKGASVLGWSIGLEDGGLGLLRYLLDLEDRNVTIDEADLDRRLQLMVRGWEPAVEAELASLTDEKRAAALMERYAATFPQSHRMAYPVAEAAQDMIGLLAMERDHSRIARLIADKDQDDSTLSLKVYNAGGAMPLSDIVPVLENFGFNVIEQVPTALRDIAYIHDFHLGLRGGAATAPLFARKDVIETALTQVIDGKAENDAFNQLITIAGLEPQAVVWLRAWHRYLRQTGLNYGVPTIVAALGNNAGIARAIVSLFTALHDPVFAGDRAAVAVKLDEEIKAGLAKVAAADEDRILRLMQAVVKATLRTNAFAPASKEALAFKLDSAKVPGLPAPLPWREVFVYSPRVEGIHLRAGPVARGGLRWSDRRDDFRTEILGLMKAQRVKNAVIVPTGAKGGFYPKRLPDMRVDRDAWLAEGTESYRIFIRTLLSITDNLVDNKVVHPDSVMIRDGDDPYFVVAADKGTASFSDVANAIALERGFWLGDAFASGGSVGYDHKAMGITARGGWVSVQRHFAEMGIDVQKEPVTVAGVGDMSGDVFGNGMLLSKAIKLVAAFDHRHIFLDPDPDPAASWKERQRLFNLPRSSWVDYDAKLISKGGGVFARSEKEIKLSPEVRALLGIEDSVIEPAALMKAILKAEVGLIWFGGIGTYLKDASEANVEVGDPANDAIRINAQDLRAKVIGEGANLGVTQAARIAFGLKGGRINTDFIDNSAGVDCSDNEVNIKIALNAEMAAGRLKIEPRNTLLASMTDEVADLVLEDNRMQTLALSIAESGGAGDLPAYVRLMEIFESQGKLDRVVEGLEGNDEYLRREAEGHGLTRPELAVLLSTAKLAAQDAAEDGPLAADSAMDGELLAAFPKPMAEAHAQAILTHRLRPQIIATKLANRMINRMGMLHPFELAEEEGCTLGVVTEAFAIAERLFDLPALWAEIDEAKIPEATRIMLFQQVAVETRAHMADMIRNGKEDRSVGMAIADYAPVIDELSAARKDLLTPDVAAQTEAYGDRLSAGGAPAKLVAKLVRLAQLDGAIGLAALATERKADAKALTKAFVLLGDALGIGWAQNCAMQMDPKDPWERLLVAGLARDFQAMRLDFLRRQKAMDADAVTAWLGKHTDRVAMFRSMIDRARRGGLPTPAMLAQIAGQARTLLGR